MKKTKLISMVLALTMILPSASALAAERSRASPAEAFTDFDPNAWYRPAIEYAVEHDIMVGVGDGLIVPDRTITRAEFVTMICRLMETYAMADVSQYEDLPTDAWYYDAVRMGLQLGVIEGVSQTQVDPSGSLTREQAVVILARVLALPAGNAAALDKYADKDGISAWAQEAVSAMTTAGHLKGYPDGALRPQQAISRAETAQLLRLCFPALLNEGNIQDTSYEQNMVLREQPLEMKNVQTNSVALLAPGMGDGTVNLKNCQVARLVCWGGKDIYIYPGCGFEEIVVARTDGPCMIHWQGDASALPKVTFTDGCHPDCKVVTRQVNTIRPQRPVPEQPSHPVTHPQVHFIPQINGSSASYSKIIASDGMIQPMTPPDWEGHVFGGWYAEPECETRVSFTQPVVNGMRFYGKWYTNAEWAEIEKLNAMTTAGTVRVDCETDILATIGADKLPCQIRCHEDNEQPLRVELVRVDTGEVVAYIDHLAPGETATEMTVAAMPEYGNYEAKLVFWDSSGEHQVELHATLYVAYLWNRGE